MADIIPITAHNVHSELFELFANSIRQTQSVPLIYPFYLISRAKRGLTDAKSRDTENIISEVGDIQTIGDCRHRMTVTDNSGNRYWITCELAGGEDHE